MANREHPDFMAKVAALKAEEDTAVGVRLAELSPIVHAQRTASRRLLSDKHRRQRAALRSKWHALSAHARLDADPLAAADRWEVSIRQQWRRVLFHAAAHRLTRQPGIRLAFKRPPPAPGKPS